MNKIDDPNKQLKGDIEHPGYLGAFSQLLTIMDELRENCPWDKKQSFESLRYLTIEELYELSDAIISKDYDALKKELGDIMLHVVFYARLGSEMGEFEMEDILRSINKKLINRHPHIYGDVVTDDEEVVKANWEKIKLKEKGNNSVLGGVPLSLPALIKAMRIQEKARGVGFEWEHKEEVWEKVKEELSEFEEQVEKKASSESTERLQDEFGDLLFSLVNYGRFISLNAEDALEHTNRKFIKRFNYIEKVAEAQGLTLSEMSLVEMDEIWEKAKLNEK